MRDLTSRLAGWAREAKRRRVWISAGAYALIALTIIELSGAIFEALLLPEWSARLVTILLILGFPIVVVLAWIFDVTPGGIRRTESDPAGENGARRMAPPRGRNGVSEGVRAPSHVRRISLEAASERGAKGTDGEARTGEGAGSERGPGPRTGAPPDPERVREIALGHVRHELKTPINAILGYSEMLLEDLGDEPDAEKLSADLGRIRSGGRELLSVVDRVLDPERIRESADDIDLEEAGRKIRVDLRTPVTSVVGYAELLVEAAMEDGREHLVPDLERIRDAGQRLLELSGDIVRVATAHVEEGDDERLTRASEMTAEILGRAGSAAPVSPQDGIGSLLVVDDNAMNRDLLSRQLARAGYLVQTAADGGEALELLRSRRFDLVLLDVIMPGVDGIEVLRAVKSDEGLAGTPVIMLSSLDDLESAIRCIDLGAEDFLSKPFHPTLLRARIGATLGVARMREQVEHQKVRLDETERFANRLLRSTFPGPIADRVREGESGIVESYGEATVLWCDVDGAARSRARDAGEVAARIHRLLTLVEEVVDDHGLEAVAQAGDGVVIAGGVPLPTRDHADRVAEAALQLRDTLAEDDDFDAPVRIGLDSGEVTAGVLGGERLGYRLWGDPVDLARALGSSAPSGRVLCAPAAYRLLRDGWRFATPGVQEVPGRGQMKTYVLEGPA